MADDRAPAGRPGSNPEISVIMPAYNAAAFIGEAIASVRSQRDVDAELVVVDDGSTDATRTVAEQAARIDPGVRVLPAEHRGVAAARNRGLAAARGGLIAFLDADDLCPPGRLARQAQFLRTAPGALVIVGELLLFERLSGWEPAPGSRSRRVMGISLTTALFRRVVFDRFGPFDEQLDYCEDLDFLLRLAEGGVALEMETEVATLYRRHAANMTNDAAKMQKYFLQVLHRSLSRRRAAGRPASLERLLMQRNAAEQEFSRDRLFGRHSRL